ncbi:MAG TPA: TonB family protein [Terriglobales bacterium]|nr:TonB family protein [Terriglobales bacterium]
MTSLPSMVGAVRATERRRHPRCRVIEKQLVTVDLGPQQRGLVVDVSVAGMAVQPYSPMAKGQASTIRFEVPGAQKAVEADAVVTWVGPSGRVGMRFDTISEAAEEALRNWVAGMMAPSAAPASPAGYSTAAYLPPSYSPWIKVSDLSVAKTSIDDEDLASLDLVSALRLVVERARSVTRATGAAIALADHADMVCRARTGIAPELGARFSPDSGLSGEVVRTGMVVRCPDTSLDLRVDRIACERFNMRSTVIVPILSGNSVIGVIEVFSPRADAFDHRDVLNLKRLAELVDAMLEAGMDRVSSKAGDPVTGETIDWQTVDASPSVESQPEIVVGDPLAELDEAIGTESLLQQRTAAQEVPGSDDVLDPSLFSNVAPVESGSVPPHAIESQPTEELDDLFERLRAETDTEDRRRRKRLILSVILVMSLSAGGLGVARALMESSGTASASAASPVSAATQRDPELQRASLDLPVRSNAQRMIATSTPQVASAKPKGHAERWTWKAATAPGTGSDMTLESQQESVSASDVVVATRGDVKIITDMLEKSAVIPRELTANAPEDKGVAVGKLIHRVNPIFPPVASTSGLQGQVRLRVAIDQNGSVEKAHQVSGNAMLGAAAIQAVQQWRYEPSKIDGSPVPIEKTIIIEFANPAHK